jgi:hypothetical protein
MAEALGMVQMRRRGLFRGCCRPVSPKLVLAQMAAPVPEIFFVQATKGNSSRQYTDGDYAQISFGMNYFSEMADFFL